LADPKADQEEVYKLLAQPVVRNVLNGYNGTIFAYGQVNFAVISKITGSKDRHRQNVYDFG